MEQFSKTTELDIVELNNTEDIPKKRKILVIIPIFVCLILAFAMWVLIMHVDNREYEKEYKDITISMTEGNFEITSHEKISVTLKGTKRDLARIKKSDIIIKITTPITESGTKELEIVCVVPENSGVYVVNTGKDKITAEIKTK